METCKLFGLDPATVATVEILMDIAGRIGTIIFSNRKNQIEKDKIEFYKRVKKYYERTLEILRKNEGSPKRLANDIKEDKLFNFLAEFDNTEEVVKALLYVDKLPKRKSHDRKEVLRAVLKVLKNISRTSFS